MKQAHQELTVYETSRSLIVETREVSYGMSIRMDGPYSLNREEVKHDRRYTIKLSAHNGLLYVRYGSTSNTKSGYMQSLQPDFAGLLGTYFTLENMPYIEAFLNKHFPDTTFMPIREREMYAKDDLPVHKTSRKLNNKIKLDKFFREVTELIIKIGSLSFPVYFNMVENRISDGFYQDRPALPQSYMKAFRAKTFQELLISLFGTYRKDLAKAVVNSSLERILWASSFKEVLDIDAIIDGLKNTDSTYADIPANMSSLAGFPKNVVKKLYLERMQWSEGIAYIEDSLEMAPMIPMEERKKCTSWDALHNIGMVHYSITVDSNTGIDHAKGFQDFFEKATIKNFNIAPMQTAKSFIETGEEMNVCVGSKSYIARAFTGEGYCFRLEEGVNKPYALFEVRHNPETREWNINQARKHKNASLEKDIYEEVKAELGKYITLGEKHYA